VDIAAVDHRLAEGRSAGGCGLTGVASAPDVRKRAFAPVVDSRTRLLILGSLPGDASLAAAQYYAHPRNAFWRLLGEVIGRDLAALPYPERLQTLQASGVGLWDVIAEAERPGSLDTAISNAQHADVVELVGRLPLLRAVAFNGALAARTGRRTLADVGEALRLIDLPSSSPAHARPFAEKAMAWSTLREVLAA